MATSAQAPFWFDDFIWNKPAAQFNGLGPFEFHYHSS